MPVLPPNFLALAQQLTPNPTTKSHLTKRTCNAASGCTNNTTIIIIVLVLFFVLLATLLIILRNRRNRRTRSNLTTQHNLKTFHRPSTSDSSTNTPERQRELDEIARRYQRGFEEPTVPQGVYLPGEEHDVLTGIELEDRLGNSGGETEGHGREELEEEFPPPYTARPRHGDVVVGTGRRQ